MAILVGTNDTTGATNDVSLNHRDGSGNARVVLRGWTATESGSATTLGLYMSGLGGTEYVKLCLYTLSGATATLLANTAQLTAANGWVTGSITSTSITSGNTYYIGFVGSSGDGRTYILYADWGQALKVIEGGSGTGYYTTPPSSGTAGDNTGAGYLAYADGTVSSPTAKKLKLLAHPSSSSAGSAFGVSYGRGN